MPKISPAQAKKLLEARRAKDPVLHFVHSPTQFEFHSSKADFRLLTGGNRSGKTATCMVELAMLLRNMHPYRKPYRKLTIIAYAISRQQAATVIQEKLLYNSEIPGFDESPLIPSREIDWDQSGSIKAGFRTFYNVQMRNGNRIYFSWSDSEETQKRIQGIKADYIFIDENAGSRKLIVESINRLRDVRDAKARGDYGEDGWHAGGIIWGATATMVNDGFDDFQEMCKDPEKPWAEEFIIQPGENPAVGVNDEAVNDFMTEEEKAIRLYGTASAADLVKIYINQYDPEVHLVEPPVITPRDNLWLGYDPGMDHPTGIVFGLLRPEDPTQIHIIGYIRHFRKTMAEDADKIRRWLKGRRLCGVVYDTVMHNTDKRGSSTLKLMKEEFSKAGITPSMGYFAAAKSHAQGITLVRRYLQPLNGMKPRLVFSNRTDDGVKYGLREFLNYRGKEATKFTGPGGVVKKEDEFPDCVRYLVMKRPQYLPHHPCGTITTPQTGAEITAVDEETGEETQYARHLRLSREVTWRGKKKRGGIGESRTLAF